MSAGDPALHLLSLAALGPQSLPPTDTTEASLLSAIQSKLAGSPSFALFHAFEPNGRLTVAHAVRYAVASRVTAALGGRYLLLIDDLGALQRLALNRDEAAISACADYALHVFTALGVLGDHVTVIRSTEFALPNTALFLEMIANSITVSAKRVQNALPPLGKKDVLTASHLIAPCLQATEALHLRADFIAAPVSLAPQAALTADFQPENPPVVLPLPAILNLKGAKSNPPKPDPKNVFFFEDAADAITQKANGAFCTDEIADNPVFQYIAFVVIPLAGAFEFNGKTYTNANAEFAADFRGLDKKLLKAELAKAINAIVEPVRESLKRAGAPSVAFTTTTQ